MTKTKTSRQLKKDAKVQEYSPTVKLADEEFIAHAVWYCLKENDPDGVIEIIEAHIDALSKLSNDSNQEHLDVSFND